MKKGAITIPNVVGVFTFLLLFSVFLPPMVEYLGSAFTEFDAIGKAVVVVIIPAFLITAITFIWFQSGGD